MDNKRIPLDKARIDAITKYVHANRDRIADAMSALMRDDDGDPLPFVLLLPMGDGTQTIANMSVDTVAGLARVMAQQLENEALAKMFARVLSESVVRVITAGELVPDGEGDGGDKVH